MKKLLTQVIAFAGSIAAVGIIAAGCTAPTTFHHTEAPSMAIAPVADAIGRERFAEFKENDFQIGRAHV